VGVFSLLSVTKKNISTASFLMKLTLRHIFARINQAAAIRALEKGTIAIVY
jgi:hypothetical protein